MTSVRTWSVNSFKIMVHLRDELPCAKQRHEGHCPRRPCAGQAAAAEKPWPFARGPAPTTGNASAAALPSLLPAEYNAGDQSARFGNSGAGLQARPPRGLPVHSQEGLLLLTPP